MRVAWCLSAPKISVPQNNRVQSRTLFSPLRHLQAQSRFQLTNRNPNYLQNQQRYFAAPKGAAPKAGAKDAATEEQGPPRPKRKSHRKTAFRVYEEDIWGSVILSKDKQTHLKKDILTFNVPIPKIERDQDETTEEDTDYRVGAEEEEEPALREHDEEVTKQRKSRDRKSQLLITKYKIKRFYGVKETYLHKLFEKSRKPRGGGFEGMVRVLERRLGTALIRANFCMTMYEARQLIVHGHVLINNKLVTKPGYLLEIGDVVSLRTPAIVADKILVRLKTKIRPYWLMHPNYLEVNYKTLQICFVDIPKREEIFYPFTVLPAFMNKMYNL